MGGKFLGTSPNGIPKYGQEISSTLERLQNLAFQFPLVLQTVGCDLTLSVLLLYEDYWPKISGIEIRISQTSNTVLTGFNKFGFNESSRLNESALASKLLLLHKNFWNERISGLNQYWLGPERYVKSGNHCSWHFFDGQKILQGMTPHIPLPTCDTVSARQCIQKSSL